jgi:hypothetical protein
MIMRRAFLTCLSAIALLFATSAAVILWATRETSPIADGAPSPAGRTEAAAAVPSPSQPSPDAAPAPGPGLDGLGVVPLPPAPGASAAPSSVAAFAAPEPPRRGAPHRAPAPVTGQRRAALAGVRRGLMAGMSDLQRRVEGCALAGATLSLSVESVKGGLRVVSARLESRGAATEDGEACARAALSGQLIRAPGVEPGQRWQLPFAVHSRG